MNSKETDANLICLSCGHHKSTHLNNGMVFRGMKCICDGFIPKPKPVPVKPKPKVTSIDCCQRYIDECQPGWGLGGNGQEPFVLKQAVLAILELKAEVEALKSKKKRLKKDSK